MSDKQESKPGVGPWTGGVDAGSGVHLRGALEEVKIIATGGMSHIFRARQPSLDRFIVVKKLKEDLQISTETLERFRREAKALASVLHQNIAHVYDFVENGRESYIVMEYIEGIDVSHIVQKVGPMPPDVAAAIALSVAKGVGYIHAHNLIHRDIKPSNIRITTRGEVKLMDFGIVMSIDNESLTRPGMMVGSPSYLSPEQVLGDAISPKADLFLMGICLYEMLTGSRPFREEMGETVFQRIREAKYVPPREMLTSVPSALDRVVQRCLKKDPDRRYASVKELQGDLERYLGPVKSLHTEDVILKFLDEEALLTPSVSYAELESNRKTLADFLPLPVVIGFIALILAAFTGGFFVGRAKKSPGGSPAPLSSFPPPKPLKTSK